MTDRADQQFGNYQLVRLLGRGGFADVYLGEHVRLHTQAAIKVLRAQLQGVDADAFLAEAQMIARLEHPHLVRILDFDIEEGVPFLVMSYAPGGTLRARHKRGICVPLDLVVSYVKEIADALQYAHDEKVIHRDVKPENMLLGRRGEVILSDFGIATLARSSYSMEVQNIAGTVAYMAPEQIQAHPRPASDQYALAVVVYEWLCGTRPFEGTYYEVMSKHLSISPPSLDGSTHVVPAEVERVIFTALAKEPKQRFDSIHTFAQELERASKSENTFSISMQLDPQPFYSAAPYVADADEIHESSESRLLKGWQGRDSGLQKSELPWFIHDAFSVGEPVIVSLPTKPPLKVDGKNNIGRRRAIAMLAGGVTVAGLAIVVGAINLPPTSHSGDNSAISTATQGVLPGSTGVATRSPLPVSAGTVIGKTTQVANSAQTFKNPADNNASLLVRLPNGDFAAYESACTHEGVFVNYDPTTHTIICPAHGAVFDPASNAKVVRRPATTPLRTVEISVNGDGTITVV